MPAIAFIDISGSPFQAGQALGRFGASAVRDHLLHTDAWRSVMRWRGTEQAALMAAQVQARFPRIWDELKGLADGLGLPLEDTFLWNCRGDVWAMSPDGCTTVQVPGAHRRRISHNEDGDPGFSGHCAIAQCHIAGSPGFASFVYPGSLPGHTFAATELGLAMTVNNLRYRNTTAGVPRMVLTRAVLDAPDLDKALAVLRDNPHAGGFHLTLGHCRSTALLSVEFSAYGCSVLDITQTSMHANHAIHPQMRDHPQIVTGSSGHRQMRGDTVIADAARDGREIDPLELLADTAHPSFPIYRDDPHDSDGENTQATADMRVGPTCIEWEVYEQPGTAPRYRMINGHTREEDATDAGARPDVQSRH
ncbi:MULTISPECIES: C45 family autoproteolytic acyltransferase/hydolase [Cupriavidus]|uniref:Peptidase C45, acyl-coenzyme A:6-aminopenicillanic acid acyl-transferase n=1 Tax=Cupriavidus pinatubonensis (strain JMP 134 / LMG 1197) TaxID=264198 RepID=Q46UY0_CUPPJ|nr:MULTISPECIES: C45 family peptidase [Cupriavidus]TPQ33591.1 peptidase C45 [Cupriavidus pinatubonensis]